MHGSSLLAFATVANLPSNCQPAPALQVITPETRTAPIDRSTSMVAVRLQRVLQHKSIVLWQRSRQKIPTARSARHIRTC